MALRCQMGHAMRGKPINVYATLVNEQDESERCRLMFCKEHYPTWLSLLAGKTEFNGRSSSGPFENRLCHWGQHDFEDGWSNGALFVLCFPDGDAREAYRALLCTEHLGEVASALGLRPL